MFHGQELVSENSTEEYGTAMQVYSVEVLVVSV